MGRSPALLDALQQPALKHNMYVFDLPRKLALLRGGVHGNEICALRGQCAYNMRGYPGKISGDRSATTFATKFSRVFFSPAK